MKKFIFLLLICVSVSCSTYKDIQHVDHDMRKLSIGMKKKRVVSILGTGYEIIGSKEGIYVLGYKSPDKGIYKLTFIDDRLVEWEKDWFRCGEAGK